MPICVGVVADVVYIGITIAVGVVTLVCVMLCVVYIVGVVIASGCWDMHVMYVMYGC